MGEKAPPGNHASIVQDTFARQARGFARSPLNTDPERLGRLIGLLEPRPGERVLDVACGPGIVTAALQRSGLQAFGIDLTREMLREAVSGAGCYVRGDVVRLPFRSGVFDAVICRNSFHHFDHPAAVLSEMSRVARPGGRVVLEDMRAPDDATQRAYQATIERLRDESHTKTLTRDEFLGLAEAAGLVEAATVPGLRVIDFDEWFNRACSDPERRARARDLMEACVENDRCGLRVWREGRHLKFERQSLLLKAARPGR